MSEEDVLLTNKAIQKIDVPKFMRCCEYEIVWEYANSIAYAELKKVVEWGNGGCPHHALTRHLNKPKHKKRECDVCWQELKRIAGLSNED